MKASPPQCLFSLIALAIGFSAQAESPRDPVDQPNVVLVMVDDVSWEAIGCYGAEDYQTPRIDDMALKVYVSKTAFPRLFARHLGLSQ